MTNPIYIENDYDRAVELVGADKNLNKKQVMEQALDKIPNFSAYLTKARKLLNEENKNGGKRNG